MHILITGASEGIGLAIAKRFASSETSDLCLSICSRNENSILLARGEIEKMCATAQVGTIVPIFAAPCDVSQTEDVKRFTADSEKKFGPVDVLVNNAGIGFFHSALDMNSSDFDRVLGTNLRGAFLVTKSVLPKMIERKLGTIVTISSVAGKNGFSGGAAYSTSKFGVRGLMQSLFLEVREKNIRVITIFPGNVDTNFFVAAGSAPAVSKNVLSADDIADAVYAAVSLPDHATITELDIRPTNPKK